MPNTAHLTGRSILLVEDDFLIADVLESELRALGATIVGPAASVAQALDLIEECGPLDAAVLDVKLRNEWIYPVAETLRELGVPFAFATGYDHNAIDPRFADVPRSEKPVDTLQIARLLFG